MAGFRRALRPLLSRQENNAEIAEIAGGQMPPARHASLAPAPRPPSGPSCVTARGPGPSAATSALGWAAGHGRPRHREPRRGEPRGCGRTTTLSSTVARVPVPVLIPVTIPVPIPLPIPVPIPVPGPVPPGAADVAGREALWARGLTRCGPGRAG